MIISVAQIRKTLPLDGMAKALDDDGVQHLRGLQLGAIREAIQATGVKFVAAHSGELGMRLRKMEP